MHGLCRVKELEALANQARETHGRTMVDKATLEEVEQLRRRVMDLELASAADAPVPPSTLQGNRQMASGPQIAGKYPASCANQVSLKALKTAAGKVGDISGFD